MRDTNQLFWVSPDFFSRSGQPLGEVTRAIEGIWRVSQTQSTSMYMHIYVN